MVSILIYCYVSLNFYIKHKIPNIQYSYNLGNNLDQVHINQNMIKNCILNQTRNQCNRLSRTLNYRRICNIFVSILKLESISKYFDLWLMSNHKQNQMLTGKERYIILILKSRIRNMINSLRRLINLCVFLYHCDLNYWK